MGKSNISYLDHVWSPITGCQGKNCQAHCYARELVKRFPAIHGWHVRPSLPKLKDGVPNQFSKVVFHPDRLNEPLKRKKPTVYGVGFFGDMFDIDVRADWIHSTLHRTEMAKQHTYIFLTKQPEKMGNVIRNHWDTDGSRLTNCWFGTTVCTQPEADERIPELLKVPGNIWISYEPALEYVNFSSYLKTGRIKLIVAGCESGPKRRNMEHSWALYLRHDCAASDTMLYVKQISLYGKVSTDMSEWPESLRIRELPWRKP